MQLSVVVPTLNARDRLAATLDDLASHAPDAEVVVVNGPSADGTTGMVRNREDVDVLVEVSDRTLNISRNAGVRAASGDTVAFLRQDLGVEKSWVSAVESGVERAPVVTGPVHETLPAGMTTTAPERREIHGREVAYFNGGNVAFRAATLDELDGFDEYLQTGGARDAAHRLAGLDCDVEWRSDMCVRTEYEADGGVTDRDYGWKYRALAYRLAKNYGIRPTVLRRVVSHAGADALSAARDVVAGGTTPTNWFGTGRDVVTGMATGYSDGLVARARDRSPARNPHGCSKRADRAVATYDRR
ncbi:glycosyl transferase family 2 [Halobellus salinus]|uniref:Glycosyl transferase family 2 n=1 Tax=Halobellus salinus TaxID=931585 RepID=A0A830EGC3_9EURY|nr:glycosyltransferase [Halobellus salinus]GGJ09320.1 glycosyl transferase family 2 [Halobellus salinus]SMP27268.1 Glycosyl transferase family 2 [Halobellus salinus]